MIDTIATHSTVLASVDDGRTQLTIDSTMSTGAGMVGFSVSHPLVPGTPAVAWLYATEFATALAGGLGLSISSAGGGMLADRYEWSRRRGVELADDGTFTVMSRAEPNPEFTLFARIARPLVGWSPRGNPTVTPVNDRVLLEIRIDGDGPAIIDPSELLAVLIDHGVVRKYDDWNRVLTRHLSEPAIAVEVLPDGRTTTLSLMMGAE